MKTILDVCCGSKMFWFDPNNERALYVDIRKESHALKDSSSKGGVRYLEISPDMVADFRKLPFNDNSFPLIVFDPPHLKNNGAKGWLAKKYGKLSVNWRDDIKSGFSECFRVLCPLGTLVFKWNENDIPLKEILELTGEKPLFGNKYGRNFNSHWIVFQKGLKP